MIGSWCLLPTFNDGFGDMGSNAVNRLLQMQGNAASAIAATAQGRFVRKADIWAECSEGLLPAISTSGGVAANYGSGYALEVMREHLVKVWEE